MSTDNRTEVEIATGPSWLQLALVALLVTAILMGPVALLRQLNPEGPWHLLPIVALITATESVITRRWLEWPTRRRQRAGYSLAELVVLLALAVPFLWLATGQSPFPASIGDLLADPFAMVNAAVIAYMLTVAIAWERAHSWSSIVIEMSVSPYEVEFYTSTQSERFSDRSIVLPLKHRSALLSAFVQSWIVGGIFLVGMVALVSFDLGAVSGSRGVDELRSLTRLGLNRDLLVALLLYFLGGLWLISQARAVILRARWLANRSRRDTDILARWRRWSFLFIVGLALLASLLPIGTTFPLFQIVQSLIGLLASIVGAILAMLIIIVYFVISLLPGNEVPVRPPLDLSQLVDPEQIPDVAPASMPSSLVGPLFWLALIGLAIIATMIYMSDRGLGISLIRLRTIWRAFVSWILGFRRETAVLASALATSIRLRAPRPSLGGSTPSPFGFLRVGGLAANEQIRFLYLSMVRHAHKRGIQRPVASTPSEFALRLKNDWPEANEDLETLTDAFLIARYGQREVDQRRLRSAKGAWLRIRRGTSRRAQEQSAEQDD